MRFSMLPIQPPPAVRWCGLADLLWKGTPPRLRDAEACCGAQSIRPKEKALFWVRSFHRRATESPWGRM